MMKSQNDLILILTKNIDYYFVHNGAALLSNNICGFVVICWSDWPELNVTNSVAQDLNSLTKKVHVCIVSEYCIPNRKPSSLDGDLTVFRRSASVSKQKSAT